MKIFDFLYNEDIVGQKSPFRELVGEKGNIYEFSNDTYNYVLFFMSGEADVTNNRNVVTSLQESNMYALCKPCAPFSLKAIDDFRCLIFVVDSLVHHVNAKRLVKILSSECTLCDELPSLSYNNIFVSFINSIILVNEYSNLMPDSFYDIKKSEFLHYMLKMYTYEELGSFIFGIMSTYSEFKRSAYSSYTNSINVEQMAESMFMTTKTFTRNFKKEFNMTPNDWLQEQRIFNLNHYILNKAMPLDKILEEFDFSTLKQFLKRHDIGHLLTSIVH